MKKHVLKEAEGKNVSPEQLQFVIDFYSNSMIGNILRWLKDGMPDKKEDLIWRLSVAYQTTIKTLIEKSDIFETMPK